MKTFIYCLRSTASTLVYIGQSIRPKVRVLQHRAEVRNGTHINKVLVDEGARYGDCFTFDVLEECDSETAHLREQHWINAFAKTHDVANLRPAGNPTRTGKKHSTETRKKMSETHKAQGRRPWHKLTREQSLAMNALKKPQTKAAEESRRRHAYVGLAELKRRPVINVNTGWIYYSCAEAAKQIGVPYSALHKACYRKRGLVQNCQWRFLDEHQSETVP